MSSEIAVKHLSPRDLSSDYEVFGWSYDKGINTNVDFKFSNIPRLLSDSSSELSDSSSDADECNDSSSTSLESTNDDFGTEGDFDAPVAFEGMKKSMSILKFLDSLDDIDMVESSKIFSVDLKSPKIDYFPEIGYDSEESDFANIDGEMALDGLFGGLLDDIDFLDGGKFTSVIPFQEERKQTQQQLKQEKMTITNKNTFVHHQIDAEVSTLSTPKVSPIPITEHSQIVKRKKMTKKKTPFRRRITLSPIQCSRRRQLRTEARARARKRTALRRGPETEKTHKQMRAKLRVSKATKEEEVLDPKRRRYLAKLRRNRASAARVRKRKREEKAFLQKQKDSLVEEIASMRKRVKTLKKRNEILRSSKQGKSVNGAKAGSKLAPLLFAFVCIGVIGNFFSCMDDTHIYESRSSTDIVRKSFTGVVLNSPVASSAIPFVDSFLSFANGIGSQEFAAQFPFAIRLTMILTCPIPYMIWDHIEETLRIKIMGFALVALAVALSGLVVWLIRSKKQKCDTRLPSMDVSLGRQQIVVCSSTRLS